LKKILIICGSGASSGFIAQNMRKAAKAKGLDINIKAVSDTELEDYLPEFDLVLVGPHLKHRFAEIEKIVEPYKIKAKIIDQKSYASLDGESILEDALE
jgi:PTS system cellobiose-specific IIB component